VTWNGRRPAETIAIELISPPGSAGLLAAASLSNQPAAPVLR
jgi:hypothetical protein